jgi:hypothetical protein
MGFINPYPVGGISVFKAKDDMPRTTGHVQTVDLSLALDLGGMARCNIYRQSTGEIFTKNPLLSTKTWLGTELAGCYVDLADLHDPGEISALTKAPDASRTVPRQTVAAAIVCSASLLPAPRWKAAIRLLPDGFRDSFGRLRAENTPSRSLFEEFAFEAAEVKTYPYKGLYHDHHLKDSLERDGTYRSLILRSTRLTLQAATDYLAKTGALRGLLG